MAKFKDLKNKKFGKLLVIERFGYDKVYRITWRCKCECGKESILQSTALISSNTKSCGKCNQYEGFKGRFWSTIKSQATKRNIEFTITQDEAWNLWLKQDGKCALSGVNLILPLSCKTKYTASLDRKDYLKSYTIDNVQWVHKIVNVLKNILQDDIFISLAHDIVKYHPDNPNKDWTQQKLSGNRHINKSTKKAKI